MKRVTPERAAPPRASHVRSSSGQASGLKTASWRAGTKGRRKPSQEEEGKEHQDGSHSGDYDLHDPNEPTVVMHVLGIVVLNVLICDGHRNLRRLSIPMLDDFRHTQAMVAYSIVCALIQVKTNSDGGPKPPLVIELGAVAADGSRSRIAAWVLGIRVENEEAVGGECEGPH